MATTSKRSPQKKKRPYWVIVLLSIILVAVVGFFIYTVAQKKAASPTSSTTSTTSTAQKAEKTSTSSKKKATKTTASSKKAASTTSTAHIATTDEILTAYIQKMSLDDRIGQVFLARVPANGTEISELNTYHLGGYLIFGKDVEDQSLETLKQKIASWQAASPLPLFIGSDEEGGTVTRLGYAGLVSPSFASPQALYARGGMSAITADWQNKAKILRNVGIQLPLAPVADVATDPNAFIYARTLGQNAATTADYISQVVKTMDASGIGSTLKHFPGYGNNGDSHTDIITDTTPLQTLKSTNYLPFSAGIKAGVDSILVAHNIVTAVDSTQPASISPAIHDVIRKELGFDGVVMTDDLDMAGLADFTTQDEAALKALQAGNDLLLSSSYAKQIPFIKTAIQNGQYTEAQLNQSILRLFRWKVKLGLLDVKNLPKL